jgi:hypothetical protein
VKLTSRFYLLTRVKTVNPYLRFSIRLRGVVLSIRLRGVVLNYTTGKIQDFQQHCSM